MEVQPEPSSSTSSESSTENFSKRRRVAEHIRQLGDEIKHTSEKLEECNTAKAVLQTRLDLQDGVEVKFLRQEIQYLRNGYTDKEMELTERLLTKETELRDLRAEFITFQSDLKSEVNSMIIETCQKLEKDLTQKIGKDLTQKFEERLKGIEAKHEFDFNLVNDKLAELDSYRLFGDYATDFREYMLGAFGTSWNFQTFDSEVTELKGHVWDQGVLHLRLSQYLRAAGFQTADWDLLIDFINKRNRALHALSFADTSQDDLEFLEGCQHFSYAEKSLLQRIITFHSQNRLRRYRSRV